MPSWLKEAWAFSLCCAPIVGMCVPVCRPPCCCLQMMEDLEQLKVLENGYRMKVLQQQQPWCCQRCTAPVPACLPVAHALCVPRERRLCDV